MKPYFICGLAVLSAALLVACGSSSGIDGATAPPPTSSNPLAEGSDIPLDATTQAPAATAVPAAISFVNSTIATPVSAAEMAEPLRTGNDSVQLATSDTDEPAEI
jgi:hypothetical protein